MATTFTPIPRLASVDDLRAMMPVTDQWIYLDNAAVSPLPRPTMQALCEWAKDAMLHGVAHWNHWQKLIEKTRLLAARLIGADADEMAFVSSTAAGIAIVAEGLNWQPGENVIVPQSEFPSNRFPWLNLKDRGVEVRQIECESDPNSIYRAVDDACDEKTKVVACSWVDYVSGFRRDLSRLASIAHRRDALFVVDAIQGLGVLELEVDASGVDILVADGRKWLLGPDGAGILYVNRNHLERIRVIGPSWRSMQDGLNFSLPEIQLKSSAARFENGILNTAGIAGLYASLQLMSQLGVGERETRLLEICGEFVEAGQTAGLHIAATASENQSGIVSFASPLHDVKSLARFLRTSGIALSLRGTNLRVSPHLYNTADEAEQFADCVCEFSSP